MSATSTCRWFVIIFFSFISLRFYFAACISSTFSRSVLAVIRACCAWLHSPYNSHTSFTKNSLSVCKGLDSKNRYTLHLFTEISYFIKKAHDVHIVTHTPVVLFILFLFFLPESKTLFLAERTSDAWWPLHVFGRNPLFPRHTHIHAHRTKELYNK